MFLLVGFVWIQIGRPKRRSFPSYSGAFPSAAARLYFLIYFLMGFKLSLMAIAALWCCLGALCYFRMSCLVVETCESFFFFFFIVGRAQFPYIFTYREMLATILSVTLFLIYSLWLIEIYEFYYFGNGSHQIDMGLTWFNGIHMNSTQS